MAAAGLAGLTREDVPGPGCADTAVSILFRTRFTRAIKPAEKEKKEKRIPVAAADPVVLASNTFYV